MEASRSGSTTYIWLQPSFSSFHHWMADYKIISGLLGLWRGWRWANAARYVWWLVWVKWEMKEIRFMVSYTGLFLHSSWATCVYPEIWSSGLKNLFIFLFFPGFSNSPKPGFSNTWTVNFQVFKLVLQKAEEPEIKLPTSVRSSKKQ